VTPERDVFPTLAEPLAYPATSALAAARERAALALSEAWAWRCADFRPDSQQARADALADAETLRRYWPIRRRFRSLVGRADRQADLIVQTRPWRGMTGEQITIMVSKAARAAFRACPGLR